MEVSLSNIYKELALKRSLEPLRELSEFFIGRSPVRGFEFTQIARSDKAYIYFVDTKLDTTHYEVFKRVINESMNVVSYPSGRVFGSSAWTFKTLEEAQKKFEEISIPDPIEEPIVEEIILNT